jgi:hypothetical protein
MTSKIRFLLPLYLSYKFKGGFFRYGSVVHNFSFCREETQTWDLHLSIESEVAVGKGAWEPVGQSTTAGFSLPIIAYGSTWSVF